MTRIYQCPKCKKEYPRTKKFFVVQSDNQTDGLHCYCRQCKKGIDKAYRLKNAEKIKEHSKSPQFVFSQLKHQAKKRGYQFNLSLEYYLNNLAFKCCHYCGAEKTKHWVDRHDNDGGYTEKNSVPCCERCNKMKMHRKPRDFINHCKRVVKYQQGLK